MTDVRICISRKEMSRRLLSSQRTMRTQRRLSRSVSCLTFPSTGRASAGLDGVVEQLPVVRCSAERGSTHPPR